MAIDEPMDLIRVLIDEKVQIKCKEGRHIVGTLHAYDPHLNLVVGDVEETTEIESEEGELSYSRRHMEILFVRGDGVILVAPQDSP